MIKKFNSAFTLAEILITLSIIGVVVALVMPMVTANVEKTQNFSKLQKAYSIISQAATQIRSDNGGDFSNIVDSTSPTQYLDFANLFNDKMMTTSFCTANGDNTNCYISDTAELKNLNGNLYYSGEINHLKTYPKVLTADGFMYAFRLDDSTCANFTYTRGGKNENCGYAWVDINGRQAPNYMGRDLFIFSINKFNVTPYTNGTCDITITNSNLNGVTCSSIAISHGKIDYY